MDVIRAIAVVVLMYLAIGACLGVSVFYVVPILARSRFATERYRQHARELEEAAGPRSLRNVTWACLGMSLVWIVIFVPRKAGE